jgi:hypothetical protein
MGIGEDGFGDLFPRHPQLRFFVAVRGTVNLDSITKTGGGVQVSFVESQ